MSLDVYLLGEPEEYFCAHCGQMATRETQLFWANVTHNLNRMAGAAGIYEACWRPEEIGVTKAAQLIERLGAGLALLQANPEAFKVLNPANGWGDYDGFVEWVGEYLAACRKHPEATVRVSR